MKIKVRDLTGPALRWAVATAEYTDGRLIKLEKSLYGPGYFVFVGMRPDTDQIFRFDPDENWRQGGPIIERELIAVYPNYQRDGSGKYEGWVAAMSYRPPNRSVTMPGRTPLEAAMRCWAAFKLGDEVGIPHELCN